MPVWHCQNVATWGSHESSVMSDTDVPATADELLQFGDEDGCGIFDDDDFVIEAGIGEPSGVTEHESSGGSSLNDNNMLEESHRDTTAA